MHLMRAAEFLKIPDKIYPGRIHHLAVVTPLKLLHRDGRYRIGYLHLVRMIIASYRSIEMVVEGDDVCVSKIHIIRTRQKRKNREQGHNNRCSFHTKFIYAAKLQLFFDIRKF